MLLAMAVADCAAVTPRWPRGALVGLATAIKLVPGVFIIYLWLSAGAAGPRTAAAGRAGLDAGRLAPAAARTRLRTGPARSSTPGGWGTTRAPSNQSLRGMLLRFFLPGQAPAAVWLAIAAAVAVAGFCWSGGWPGQSRPLEAIAMTGLIAVLLSPVVVDTLTTW